MSAHPPLRGGATAHADLVALAVSCRHPERESGVEIVGARDETEAVAVEFEVEEVVHPARRCIIRNAAAQPVRLNGFPGSLVGARSDVQPGRLDVEDRRIFRNCA